MPIKNYKIPEPLIVILIGLIILFAWGYYYETSTYNTAIELYKKAQKGDIEAQVQYDMLMRHSGYQYVHTTAIYH